MLRKKHAAENSLNEGHGFSRAVQSHSYEKFYCREWAGATKLHRKSGAQPHDRIC
jgi:hypothetical protein